MLAFVEAVVFFAAVYGAVLVRFHGFVGFLAVLMAFVVASALFYLIPNLWIGRGVVGRAALGAFLGPADRPVRSRSCAATSPSARTISAIRDGAHSTPLRSFYI